jgi:hypothetical protein
MSVGMAIGETKTKWILITPRTSAAAKWRGRATTPTENRLRR